MPVLDVPLSWTASSNRRSRHYFLGTPFDTIGQDAAIRLVKDSDTTMKFRYIVTPNVDHVVRLDGNRSLAPYYDEAWLSLCDSKPISILSNAVSLSLPLVTGSDLTARLFQAVIKDGDLVTLIAANAQIVHEMERSYPKIRFRSMVPPCGVLHNPAALQNCIDFVAAEPARFAFIAIGSPQSEKIAHALTQRTDACGVGLCIGASLEFLVGAQKRAPLWVRQLGMEWAHRLSTDPKRLWRRYVFAVTPLVRLFVRELLTRARSRPV